MPLVCAEKRDESAYLPFGAGSYPAPYYGLLYLADNPTYGICTDLVALVIIWRIAISVNQSDARVSAWEALLKKRYVNP